VGESVRDAGWAAAEEAAESPDTTKDCTGTG
jgi:hypothetical protein